MLLQTNTISCALMTVLLRCRIHEYSNLRNQMTLNDNDYESPLLVHCRNMRRCRHGALSAYLKSLPYMMQ
jgi:hypothetical protein